MPPSASFSTRAAPTHSTARSRLWRAKGSGTPTLTHPAGVSNRAPMTVTAAVIPVMHSIKELGRQYRAWLVDIWGVMHNGYRAFPRAVEATQAFRAQGGVVVLLSNSPRPSPSVRNSSAVSASLTMPMTRRSPPATSPATNSPSMKAPMCFISGPNATGPSSPVSTSSLRGTRTPNSSSARACSTTRPRPRKTMPICSANSRRENSR